MSQEEELFRQAIEALERGEVPSMEAPQQEESAPQQEEPVSQQEEPAPQEEPEVPENLKPYVDKLKKEAEEWKHKYESDRGRILAAQKKLQELAMQQPQTQPQTAVPARWRQLLEESPELASAIEEYVQTKLGSVASVTERYQQQLEVLRQIEQQRYIESQYKILEQMHPDWKEVAATDDFKSWLVTQPPSVQALANSTDAGEVSVVLNAYKAVKTPAKAIQQARAERKKQAALPEVKGEAVPPEGLPEDPETLFNLYARQIMEEDEQARRWR